MTRRAILWVNQFAALPADGGGTRHFDLARALVRRGRSVMVLACDYHLHRRVFTKRPASAGRELLRETVEGVEFGWAWAAPYRANNWRRLWNWLSFAWEVYRAPVGDGGPSLVIGSSPQPFAALGAWGLARRLGVPFVFEVRDLWPESLEAVAGTRGPFYHILGVVARFLYRRADAVIVLAKGSAPVIEAAGVAPDRIWFIPNGIAPDGFPEITRPPRATLTLMYAGAHGPANGLDAVLDAADRLRDEAGIRFLLVGDGPAKAALVAEAGRRRLTNVEFRDPVSKPELVALMAEVDAGLMVLKETPLFAYGVSPNKLFDYFGASLPVVCNVPGDVAQMLSDAEAGVQATDGSGAALAAAVRRMAALPAEARGVKGKKGRAWVLRERDRDKLGAELDEMLERLG